MTLYPRIGHDRLARVRGRAFAALLLLVSFAGLADAEVRALAPWSPSDAGVRIEAAPGVVPPGVVGPSAHVSGPSNSAWNYIHASALSLQAGQRYRLSAWLRIDRVGQATPAPYLKCEFLDVSRRNLGRVQSEPYDLGKLGAWQRISVEFLPPVTSTSCYAALEKGVQSATEIDAYVAGGSLEAIANLAAAGLPGVPAEAGGHPRLFLDSQAFVDLRERIQTTHAAIWRDVQRQADRLVACLSVTHQRRRRAALAARRRQRHADPRRRLSPER